LLQRCVSVQRSALLITLLLSLAFGASAAQTVAKHPGSLVRFKILGFNDFHGQLETTRLQDRPVGGAAVLASYLKAAGAAVDGHAIIAHAGDQVGASPPASALSQDEPAIAFLNLLGNNACRAGPASAAACNLVGTPGNHEFDEGLAEFLRLLNGGPHPRGPFLDPQFAGAGFPYVSANIAYRSDGQLVLPPYTIKTVRGQPIGFIGATLTETAHIVIPQGVSSIRFLDEASAINRAVKELKQAGVRAIVVLIHQGSRQSPYPGPTRPALIDPGPDIAPLVAALDDEVDIVVSGHWHQFTNALVPTRSGKPVLVTQAYARGTAFADIDVGIDPASGDIVEKSARIVTTWADTGPGATPDREVAALVHAAVARVKPLVERVVGVSAAACSKTADPATGSALGRLVADAQRAALNTDVALMNPGGIRAGLPRGNVSWGDLFALQPFGNQLVKVRLSGAELLQILEQQWGRSGEPRLLHVSGMTYQWQHARQPHVLAASVRIGDQPLHPDTSYSLAVNSYLAAGGDGFSHLAALRDQTVGADELEALVRYIEGLPQPFSAPQDVRVIPPAP
jgi:5'-nucleotidase